MVSTAQVSCSHFSPNNANTTCLVGTKNFASSYTIPPTTKR